MTRTEVPMRMVHAVRPDLRVECVEAIERGTHELWFVTIETSTGTQDCVLKAKGDSPEATAQSRGIAVEARLLELLGVTTDLPVPEVLGRVDSHEDLPTPFFLMTHLDGSPIETDAWELPTDRLVSLARTIGEHLGQLHAVAAFDAFGEISTIEETGQSEGTRSLGREYGLSLSHPTASWRDRVERIVDEESTRFSESRFGDLEPRVRTALESRMAAIDEPNMPAIAQFDYNLENVLVDPETDAVCGRIDWEMAGKATDPEWHLTWTEANFCQTLPLDSRRRDRVKTALYEGYIESNSLDRGSQFAERRRFYHLFREVIATSQLEHFPGDESAHRKLIRELS